jgi:SAM-dependent methyltransferase
MHGMGANLSTPSKESQVDYSIQYERSHPSDPALRDSDVRSFLRAFSPLLVDTQCGKAIDVGCGTGAGVEALRALGFDAVGIEGDVRQAEACRRFAVPVVETSDLANELLKNRGSLAVVVMFDLLEHLDHDAQLSLLKAARVALSDQGRVLLQVPNASSPMAAHRLYDDWTHRCSFTDRSLDFLLRNAGYDVVEFVRPKLGRRPSVRLWRAAARRGLTRWIIERAWQVVLRAELGRELGTQMPPIGVDMICVAR